jgi:rhodanese-related sulfurtransferase
LNAPITEAEAILARASERGQAKGLTYAGEVTPREAAHLIAHGARLIDVRSAAEFHFVGRVPDSVLVEWNHWPSGNRNPAFLDELAKAVSREDIVLFLCRSGVRSHHAAGIAAAAGYANVFNVLEGFEGDRDQGGRRGRHNGWRHAGLDWIQS